MSEFIAALLAEARRRLDADDLSASGGHVGEVQDLTEWGLVKELTSAADALRAEIARRDAVAKANWGDQEDEYSAAISASHPANTHERHEVFDLALEMIGARHGKYELVALVNWLLLRVEKAEAERDYHAREHQETVRAFDALVAETDQIKAAQFSPSDATIKLTRGNNVP